MAARPNPHSALKLCVRLAKNSHRRLENSIESTQSALDTNVRLTPAERDAYKQALALAGSLSQTFLAISETLVPKLPRAPAERRIGRPSRDEVLKAEARRKREHAKSRAL